MVACGLRWGVLAIGVLLVPPVTSWTAVHQWTPVGANITLLTRPGDGAGAVNVSARWRILHVSDVHISLGEATELHPTGTRRMHGAFRGDVDRHIEPGARRPPSAMFERLLDLAERSSVDALVLSGDIVNFPHNGSVQFVLRALASRRAAAGHRLPVIYTAGNHDWFVEGHSQNQREQRSRFRREVLRPLYAAAGSGRRLPRRGVADAAADGAALELEGLRPPTRRVGRQRLGGAGPDAPRLLLLSVDNSLHQVDPEQAAFVEKELARGLPTLLVVHVPFMLPGATPSNNKFVLCGDPRFGFAGDTSWQVERRERWPRSGTSDSTRRFVEDLVRRFAAPAGNLLAVLGGHEHGHRVDRLGPGANAVPKFRCAATTSPDEAPRCRHAAGYEFGLPLHEGLVQYVAEPGYRGGHRLVEVRDARRP